MVGPELGEGPRPHILAALDALSVQRRLGVSLAAVDETGARLSDGTELVADTVVWTAGMLASPLAAQIPAGRDRLGRLEVDDCLPVVSVPGVYAAGDTAAATAPDGYPVMQSCQHAMPRGKFAGHNVAADLLGVPPAPFDPNPYVTCLDLGSAGAVYSTGRERTVVLVEQEAKNLKRTINAEWIYPPLDDAEEILAKADHVSTFPTDRIAAASQAAG